MPNSTATVSYLAAPDAFPMLLAQHLSWMRVHNYTASSVKKADYVLSSFVVWCHERGIHEPKEVTRNMLERYQTWLFAYRTTKDKPLKISTQSGRLTYVRMFFKWMSKERLILFNPASEIELPKRERTLPRNVLTVDQIEKILKQPAKDTILGIRDRAVLETFYTTGMRRLELSNLETYDIQFEYGTLLIRQGKGHKDRVIPISKRACIWIQKYLEITRPELIKSHTGRTLFLSTRGNPMSMDFLSKMVRDYIEKAEIKVEGACHVFRHTMATLMLENGADTRHIQKILGHANLNTTQIYTRVSIKKLKEVHEATHPGAKNNETKPTH